MISRHTGFICRTRCLFNSNNFVGSAAVAQICSSTECRFSSLFFSVIHLKSAVALCVAKSCISFVLMCSPKRNEVQKVQLQHIGPHEIFQDHKLCANVVSGKFKEYRRSNKRVINGDHVHPHSLQIWCKPDIVERDIVLFWLDFVYVPTEIEVQNCRICRRLCLYVSLLLSQTITPKRKGRVPRPICILNRGHSEMVIGTGMFSKKINIL